jgi:hypothetical protein
MGHGPITPSCTSSSSRELETGETVSLWEAYPQRSSLAMPLQQSFARLECVVAWGTGEVGGVESTAAFGRSSLILHGAVQAVVEWGAPR